ncbi:hypothetical protein [Streptomyces sp. NPDC102437]|uniref:hypothetical protein n=1 Tax=Streptomyces sp. NPDC102437 TaxID=3366175 RepID=UPI00382AECAE
MRLFGRKSDTAENTETSKPVGKLALTTQARIHPDDPRTKGHVTTYQSSRGGWFKPRN